MFPEEFVKRIKTQQYIDSELLLESLREPSPASIRINNSKWAKKPFLAEQVPWCSEGWYLDRRPSYTLDPLFHAGCYYPQEASGMFTGEIFRIYSEGRKDLKVLDLCAAPGGKCTHLSSLLGSNGILIANEVIKPRAKILAENITRWGTGNTIVTNNDPSDFSEMNGYFDFVLVDAPCSGEGMFRDPVAVREWSVSNTLLCAERQKRILDNVWPALKEDGLLIYSTCTFNPAENEEQVSWLVQTRKAECLRPDISSFKGIREIEYKGITGYGFYPGMVRGEGFFISVIRKQEECESGVKRKGKKGVSPDMRSERIKLSTWLTREPETIINKSGRFYSVPVPPKDFSMLSNHLNIVKWGTELGIEKNRDFIPSHELVLSGLLSPENIPSVNLTLVQAVGFLRKDQLNIESVPAGWIVVKYLGISLGLIKNIGSRLNNYLPSDWRIRMEADPEKLRSIISWIG